MVFDLFLVAGVIVKHTFQRTPQYETYKRKGSLEHSETPSHTSSDSSHMGKSHQLRHVSHAPPNIAAPEAPPGYTVAPRKPLEIVGAILGFIIVYNAPWTVLSNKSSDFL